MLDPNRPNGIFDLNKSGSAHGNRTQAAKGQIWKDGTSNSSMFPTVIIEGEARSQIPAGFKGSRTNFKLSPWEDIPMGHRIGFKTGEMPLDNLGYFQKLGNGKYSYQGTIIPDKRININDGKLFILDYLNMNKPKRVWDALSGQYFTALPAIYGGYKATEE